MHPRTRETALMKQIEVRRHGIRKQGKSLSKDGWQLAKKMGRSLAGDYDLAVSSPKTRCRETMEAFGITVYTEDPALLPLDTDEINQHKEKIREIARKEGCTSFAACFKVPETADALRKQGEEFVDVLRAIARDLPEGRTALVVSHGGRIEPGMLIAMDAFDLEKMGGELAPCEGGLFRFEGDQLVGVEVLRV